MTVTEILKIVFLFLGVWWSLINTVKTIRGQELSVLNFIFQAIGITGFVYIQFLYAK